MDTLYTLYLMGTPRRESVIKGRPGAVRQK